METELNNQEESFQNRFTLALTINLDLLNLFNDYIYSKKIKNKSLFIENLIRKDFGLEPYVKERKAPKNQNRPNDPYYYNLVTRIKKETLEEFTKIVDRKGLSRSKMVEIFIEKYIYHVKNTDGRYIESKNKKKDLDDE